MVRGIEGRAQEHGLFYFIGLLKNTHLRRFPHPSSLRRTLTVRLTPQDSGALHLDIFKKPEGNLKNL